MTGRRNLRENIYFIFQPTQHVGYKCNNKCVQKENTIILESVR
jgi:hypothetical protein